MFENNQRPTRSELVEINNELVELQFDMQSNSSSILLKPIDMHKKIISYLDNLNEIEQKLLFFRRSESDLDSISFRHISELEKKIAILRNQLELDIKILKKSNFK